MDIIWDKVNTLNFFEKKSVSNSDTYRDMLLTPNAEGYEFVQKYTTYSNYLKIMNSEKEQEKAILRRNNTGTYWGGIGSFLAFIISIISLINSNVNSSNEATNTELKHSIDSINLELKKVIQSNEKILKAYSKKDSLNVIRRK